MKEESKIFKEWYELNFEELPSPLEVDRLFNYYSKTSEGE